MSAATEHKVRELYELLAELEVRVAALEELATSSSQPQGRKKAS